MPTKETRRPRGRSLDRDESSIEKSTSSAVEHSQALGILETRSLVALIQGADTMAKTATLTIMALEKIGCAWLSVTVRGSLADVTVAIEAGAAAARVLDPGVSTLVIPAPHSDLEVQFPIRSRDAGSEKDQEAFVCHC